jgi:hypothetical protein
MEARAPRAGSRQAKAEPGSRLQKGQVWKVKETYVQIVDAGKTLIHYTMSAKPRQRGLRVQMATRETVQGFLKSNQAKLVSTDPTSR